MKTNKHVGTKKERVGGKISQKLINVLHVYSVQQSTPQLSPYSAWIGIHNMQQHFFYLLESFICGYTLFKDVIGTVRHYIIDQEFSEAYNKKDKQGKE